MNTNGFAAGFTTLRYQQSWVFFNPGESNYLLTSWEGIVKFYEHCWWAGIKIAPQFKAIQNELTCVISSEKAIEIARILRDRYAHLTEICQLLDNGETWIQDTDSRLLNASRLASHLASQT